MDSVQSLRALCISMVVSVTEFCTRGECRVLRQKLTPVLCSVERRPRRDTIRPLTGDKKSFPDGDAVCKYRSEEDHARSPSDRWPGLSILTIDIKEVIALSHVERGSF